MKKKKQCVQDPLNIKKEKNMQNVKLLVPCLAGLHARRLTQMLVSCVQSVIRKVTFNEKNMVKTAYLLAEFPIGGKNAPHQPIKTLYSNIQDSVGKEKVKVVGVTG